MSAVTEILTSDRMLMYRQKLVECAADESQGQQVPDAALGEYLYLDLDGKQIPRRGCRRETDFSGAATRSAVSNGHKEPNCKLRTTGRSVQAVVTVPWRYVRVPLVESSPPFVDSRAELLGVEYQMKK